VGAPDWFGRRFGCGVNLGVGVVGQFDLAGGFVVCVMLGRLFPGGWVGFGFSTCWSLAKSCSKSKDLNDWLSTSSCLVDQGGGSSMEDPRLEMVSIIRVVWVLEGVICLIIGVWCCCTHCTCCPVDMWWGCCIRALVIVLME
jgi:hypothetical protein